MHVRSIAQVLVAAALTCAALTTGTAAPAGAAPPAVCKASEVSTITGPSNGAAGTIFTVLQIVNHSSHTCRLSGTPASRPGTLSGSPAAFKAVGPASVPRFMTHRGVVVALAPHAKASVVLAITQAANYQASSCVPKSVNAVRLTFTLPGQIVRLTYKLANTKVCTEFSSTSVEGIASGITAP